MIQRKFVAFSQNLSRSRVGGRGCAGGFSRQNPTLRAGKPPFSRSSNGDVTRRTGRPTGWICTGLCSFSAPPGENCPKRITVENSAFSTFSTWLSTWVIHRNRSCGENVDMHGQVYINTRGEKRQIVHFLRRPSAAKRTGADLWKIPLDSPGRGDGLRARRLGG